MGKADRYLVIVGWFVSVDHVGHVFDTWCSCFTSASCTSDGHDHGCQLEVLFDGCVTARGPQVRGWASQRGCSHGGHHLVLGVGWGSAWLALPLAAPAARLHAWCSGPA